MKTIYKTLIFTVFSVILPSLNAQQMEDPKSLLSPNVATLGTFRDPDVALYTGTPSISIPLFEVPLSDYVLPIELQYNGTSILVDQPPSWVGLGWNLSAGGVITRKVNDEPDEHSFADEAYDTPSSDIEDPRTFYTYNDGFYYSYSALDTVEWMHFKPKKGAGDSNLYYNYYYFFDTEPDEFTFSFPGYHGHFYLNHHGKWEVQCSQSVSVELISKEIRPPFPCNGILSSFIKKQPACFAGFIIKIEDGTQFVFGNDTSAIEFCTDLFTHKQIMHANAWHLTKIILPNNQQITFSYRRQAFTNQMSYNYNVSKSRIFDSTPDSPPGPIECWGASFDSWKHICGRLLSPVYLREINTPVLSIVFHNSVSRDLQYRDSVYIGRLYDVINNSNYHNSLMPYVTNFEVFGNPNVTYNNYLPYINQNLKRYKLDSIVVSAANSCRKVAFYYDEDTTSRLSLREVEFADKSTYHFGYNHLSDLPHYISFKTDHWGYFNNISSRLNALMGSTYYSSLEPNINYSKYGLLTKLYHPTGGVTEFEYESNDYSQQVAESRWEALDPCHTNKYGGGVRIRKISHFDNAEDEQPTLTKEYFYKLNYISNPNSQQSSGILGARFKYSYIYSATGMPGVTIDRDIFSTNSVLPNCGYEVPVGYSEVTEELSSGGQTFYKYSDYTDFLDEEPEDVIQEEQSAYGKYTSNSIYRGLLLSKCEYNNQRQILHKTSFMYTPNKSIDKYVRSVNVINLYACSVSNGFFEEGASYKFYTHTMVPETVRDVWYSSNGDSIVKTIKNHYDLQSQMPTQIDEMSMTDTITQTFRYPFTVRSMVNHLYGPYMNDMDELCANMIKGHFFLPLEITSYKRNKAVNSIYYHYGKHNTQNSYCSVDSISVLGITEPMSFTPVTLTQKDNHYIVPAKQSCKYDAYGNIEEIITDGVPVSYVWGFNHSYVVAKIVGISYSQVQSIINSNSYHLILMSTSCPTLTSLASFRATVNATYPQAQCYTYQYNPLYGIISETDPKGQTVFYDYDAMGRLKEVYYKEDNTKRVVKEYKYHLKDFE